MKRWLLLLAVCGCGLDEWPGPVKGPQGSANIGPIRALSVGSQNACVVTQVGALYCWGDNGYGQLGVDPMATFWSDRGKRNAQITTATQVAITDNGNICIVDGSGAVQCIGSGQALGDNTTMPRATFAPAAIGSVTAIAGGDGFCAVSGGTVSCWGAGSPYEPVYLQRMPTAVPGPTGVTAVYLTQDHGCALATGGQLWCWGNGGSGQLGDGQCMSTPAQGAVQSGSITATDVGLAASTTCTITGGDVECVGVDVRGGGAACAATPMSVNVSGVQHIVGGDSFFCTSDPQGTVACWGDNSAGELGTGMTGPPSGAAQAVTGLGATKLLAAGGVQACAVTSDDKVYCWGQDNGVARGATMISFD